MDHIIYKLIYFNKKKFIRSTLFLIVSWSFIALFIFHGIRGILRLFAVVEYQETSFIALSLSLFFILPSVYILLKKVHNKNCAIAFLDTKLASFYRDNDCITGNIRDKAVDDYDLYYGDDVKKEILNSRCYIRNYKHDEIDD